MPTKSAIRWLAALALVLPTLLATQFSAKAQNVVSKREIIQQLQIRKHRHGGQRQLRRAPGNHTASQPRRTNKRVVRRRAPSQGQVAVRRAPTSQQEFRAPSNHGRVEQFRAPGKVTKRRAPGRVVKRRAPGKVAKRRAPPKAVETRAPTRVTGSKKAVRAPKRVAKRRAPQPNTQTVVNTRQQGGSGTITKRRAPQHFNNQVASNSQEFGERGIAINPNGSAYSDASSIDLEILFDYNSAKIDPKSVFQLMELAKALQAEELQGTQIVVAGHTDATGGYDYNLNLSFLRAQSVTDFLVNYAGISADRLAIEGYGEERLKYPDAPNSGQNRRVEIINLGT